MKQNITPEQLQELNEEQKDRLQNWWEPMRGDMVSRHVDHNQLCLGEDDGWLFFECERLRHRSEYLPLLSIGQMIELLNQKRPVDINFLPNEKIWTVMLMTDYSPKGEEGTYWGDGPDWESEELADALWGAVKEIL